MVSVSEFTVPWVTCYGPIRGYYGKTVNPETGRRPIVFRADQSHSGVPLELPCGKCIGCVLEKARMWSLRIMHEKRMHSESAFLTLTYSDRKLPPHGGLEMPDLQRFLKRLRKQRSMGLRYFACGEYGEITKRPHYHVLLLNTCFTDLRIWKKSGENPLYVSADLQLLWRHGDSYVGEVTNRSAAYVAGYVTKKAKKSFFADGVGKPEFTCMSRNPGIGQAWFDKYHAEAYKWDSAIADGRQVRLPRFYDDKYDAIDTVALEKIKKKRRLRAMELREDNTPARLRVRERIDELNLARIQRERMT